MICIWHLLMATYAVQVSPISELPPLLFVVDTGLMRNTTVASGSKGKGSWMNGPTCSSLCRRHVSGQLEEGIMQMCIYHGVAVLRTHPRCYPTSTLHILPLFGQRRPLAEISLCAWFINKPRWPHAPFHTLLVRILLELFPASSVVTS